MSAPQDSLSLTSPLGTFTLDPQRRSWHLTLDGRPVLSGRLGTTLPEGPPEVTRTDDLLYLEWPQARLTVAADAVGIGLAWEGTEVALEDQVDLESGRHWYGGGELVRQQWPLETMRLELDPFHTWDQGPTGLGNVLHPMWSSASGGAIAVDATLPLHVALNAPREAPPPRPWRMGAIGSIMEGHVMPEADDEATGDRLLRLRAVPAEAQPVRLDYRLTAHAHATAAQQHLLAQLPRPVGIPPESMWAAPIWTTWARYKMAIDQETVLRFARRIDTHDFPRSILEIDDKWQSAYGDIKFDPEKFPDPKAMVERLHERGFMVTCWVMPFATAESEAYEEGADRGYWVLDGDGRPGQFRWWQGEGVALDVTNPAAVDWFVGRLRALQEEVGLDGYKFDAGEHCYLPKNWRTHEPIHPNQYTTRWVREVASKFELAEVRSAYRNQDAPIWIRLWDRFSSWGYDNGLQSMIPATLTFGLLGYPWVLPDMIGGNAYEEGFPDRELFIRWLQTNALLPSLQFSIAPWDYDDETVQISRRALEWHERVTPTLLRLAEEATRTGHPPIRPLYWLDPTDEATHTIADQFAVGQDMVVAPVVSPGQRSRDLYLPAGRWRDVLRGDEFEGSRWYQDYPAPLDFLPWFERVPS